MNGDEKPQVMEYSRLPSPPRAPRSKKSFMVRIGWLLVLGPLIVMLTFHSFVSVVSVIAPGTRLELGDMTLIASPSQGRAMECFRLFMAALLLVLVSAMLRHGLRSARKHED